MRGFYETMRASTITQRRISGTFMMISAVVFASYSVQLFEFPVTVRQGTSSRGRQVTKDEILPPTCQLHNMSGRIIDQIVLLHMRKAGGTSIRSYLKQVAAKYGIQFTPMEAPSIPPVPGNRTNVLYITHVREPIARAISNYKVRKFDQNINEAKIH